MYSLYASINVSTYVYSHVSNFFGEYVVSVFRFYIPVISVTGIAKFHNF